MQSGIYAIEQRATGAQYIGSTKDFRKRFEFHRWQLRTGRHRSSRLQRAWDKHGEDAFVFRVLFVCAPKDLLFYEQRAIDGFDSFRAGFNACPCSNSPTRWTGHSAATKAKIGAGNRGKKRDAAAKAKMRAAKLGKRYGAAYALARSRLTPIEVSDIRALVAAKRYTGRVLAMLFDVSPVAISMIAHGHRWQ